MVKIHNQKQRNYHKRGKIITAVTAAAMAFSITFTPIGNIFREIGSTDVYAETSSGEDYDEVAVDLTGLGAGYATILYNSTNGLPTSESNAVAETREGFIWVGGYSGLVRYDGVHFERIDSTAGISSVVSLYVDSKNRLWIGTNEDGVFVHEDGKFSNIEQTDELTSSSIRAMAEDSDGNIIVATTHGLGIIGKDMKLQAINIPQLNEEYIKELRVGPNNLVYGCTVDGAIFTYKDQQLQGYYAGKNLGTGNVRTFLPDFENPGFVYIGTEDSSLYYGNLDKGFNNFKTIDVSPLSNTNSIEHIAGKIWLCSDNGIGMVNNNKTVILKNIPMTKSIDNMMADYEGNIWFTSSRQGLMKIVPNEFTDLSARSNLDKYIVNSACLYGSLILMGTDSGLKLIDNKDPSNKYPKLHITSCTNESTEKLVNGSTDMVKLLDGVRIRSIIKDSKGMVWISTYGDLGLIRYNAGKITCFTESDGIPSHKIRTTFEKEDGTIMVACSGGLALIKGDEVTDVYDSSVGISNTEILTVSEDDNGIMYLGSDGDGIYVVDGNKISSIGKHDGLKSEVILRIKRDKKRGLYWIVTSNSIAYMKDGKITTIEKFPYSNNFDLFENSYGDMWILSSNGIYVVNSDELLANGELNYSFYNADTGMPFAATANSYSYLDKDSTLYVAGNEGVFSVNIDNYDEDINYIKMAIPYADADGEVIYANNDGIIKVPSSAKRITIYPFVLTYSLKNPKVTYTLEGFDNDSTTVESKNLEPVSYTNLSGGKYRFKMTLTSNVSSQARNISVRIEKEKAIYEYLWFKLVLGLLAILIIGGEVALYYRKKTQTLLKKQRENRIFIREMIEAFAKTIDMKDKYTNGHSSRVAEYTAMLAEQLGYDDEEVEKFYNIALLHDIGKIGIPPEVLNKPGKLTDQEFNIIKSHSALGYKALKDISIMPELAVGAGAHHERPDGKGYPKGLKGDEVPRVAQIIGVADTFDAMYSDRPYRKRMNFDKAVSIIKEVSGTQLYPDVVDAFVKLVEKGKFRAPDDDGGGTTEDINNIHKQQQNKIKNGIGGKPTDSKKDTEAEKAEEGRTTEKAIEDKKSESGEKNSNDKKSEPIKEDSKDK